MSVFPGSILFAATTLMMEPKKDKKPKNAYDLSGVENGAFANNEKINSNVNRFWISWISLILSMFYFVCDD